MAVSDGLELDIKERAVADWAFRNRQPAGRGTDTLISAELIYLPLQTPASELGVLGVRMEDEDDYRSHGEPAPAGRLCYPGCYGYGAGAVLPSG